MPRTAGQSATYAFLLGVLAFASFWERANAAGMTLAVLALTVAGLALGRVLDSPAPAGGPPPDSDGPPLPEPPHPLPDLNLPEASFGAHDSPFVRDLLSRISSDRSELSELHRQED